MEEKNKVISYKAFENMQRYKEREKNLKESKETIFNTYKSDIKGYINYCRNTEQEENEDSYLDYLYVLVIKSRVKKTTWEKRVIAIRKYLSIYKEVAFHDNILFEVAEIRKLYQRDEYSKLKRIKGKVSTRKDEVLTIIDNLPIRQKAICLVHLITASRPSEMVRLKVEDFDLENRSVLVNMKKQDEWYEKRLTLEVVKAVREYVSLYTLKPEDYFVGRVYKNGRYESKQISETAYRKQLKNWTELSPYNLRKSQVSAMHVSGADLSTIAKQTGHKSVHTLEKHYLNVSDSTIDKYL